MNEQETESLLQARGANAPRLSPQLIDGVIESEQYYVFPGATVTVCCLTLRNGFNSVGTSASVSSENFDEEIGRKVAREHARAKIWELEGYALAERLWLSRGE